MLTSFVGCSFPLKNVLRYLRMNGVCYINFKSSISFCFHSVAVIYVLLFDQIDCATVISGGQIVITLLAK